MAADLVAQVFRRADPSYPRAIVGCAYGYHAPLELGAEYEPAAADNGPGVGNRKYVLSGTMVAYEEAEQPESPEPFALESSASWRLIVRNLLTGRIVHDVPTGVSDTDAFGVRTTPWVGIGPVAAIVVKSDGSAAWVAADRYASTRTGCCHYQVRVVEKSGSRLLSAGPGIEGSLAVVGDRVYWTEDGRARSGILR